MQLTPLRFSRSFLDEDTSPRYGSSFYITDCERFAIFKAHGDKWYLVDRGTNGWFGWLKNVGLADVPFPTRREALTALHETLTADNALDNTHAPTL